MLTVRVERPIQARWNTQSCASLCRLCRWRICASDSQTDSTSAAAQIQPVEECERNGRYRITTAGLIDMAVGMKKSPL